MSHNNSELQFPIVDPEPLWEWYYWVPLLDRNEWDGIEYDSIKYDWQELDYRFGVDYPSIPEPADTGFYAAVIVAFFVLICLIITQKPKW